MGKYSSDSDSSDNHRRKKVGRSRKRSSSSSSSSRYSSRSKKSKKSTRKYKRSRSPERHSRRGKRSRDRSSSRHRQCRRSEKHSSKRRSRSNSNRSSYSRNRDRSYSKERRKSPSISKNKRSDSPTSKLKDKNSPIFDSVELLERLNKAASEALSDKKLENLFNENQPNRYNVINEINSPYFLQKEFSSKDHKDEVTVVPEPTALISFNHVQLKEEPGSLLHPNLLIEDQNDKLNRWIRKLYLIRQKFLHGEVLLLE